MRRVYEFFNGVTEQIYRPIRRVIPTVYGGVDIAPVIVLVILQLINYTLIWASKKFGL
jgi:YggT family protein